MKFISNFSFFSEKGDENMKAVEEKILAEGKVFPGDVLKVSSFLNHRIDVDFVTNVVAKEFYEKFKNENITKVLTIENSGIAIAFATAQWFKVPCVFAKKTVSINIDTSNCYTETVHSYTHGNDYVARIEKDFLNEGDRVLIIDDFLATGEALAGLVNLISTAGATCVGCGVVIEKAFQYGGNKLRNKGIEVQSLARISKMDENGTIEFEE